MKLKYYQQCVRAWDGDAFGNEWRCGYTAFPPDKSDPAHNNEWTIYEDDGAGNGDFVCRVVDEAEAIRTVQDLCTRMDNGDSAWLRQVQS